ncbi:cold-shock protein [Kineococcus sp. SYSU DK005]|uniref:cold-shock protein n=1 Tax=Kineococcus sp. SYSU DK005 TaxID=3383126 RepID=UPI003D7DE25E
MSTRGVVRDWHDEQGWGVIDSPETPGGCWVHFSAAVSTQDGLRPGQEVAFTYERGEQDGYRYRARRAWPWGEDPVQRPGTTVFNDRSGAFTSSLTLTHDDPASAESAQAAEASEASEASEPPEPRRSGRRTGRRQRHRPWARSASPSSRRHRDATRSASTPAAR